ncbi:MAG: hypothetical protein COB93_01975 [Sneathiella sp.]|nr:MAG: hypothetical protein COB93_01975 [Sneathiella sp.]
MDSYNHYIIKHVILNDNFEFAGEQAFNPETDSPISEYNITELNSAVYVILPCNKYDARLNVLML